MKIILIAFVFSSSIYAQSSSQVITSVVDQVLSVGASTLGVSEVSLIFSTDLADKIKDRIKRSGFARLIQNQLQETFALDRPTPLIESLSRSVRYLYPEMSENESYDYLSEFSENVIREAGV